MSYESDSPYMYLWLFTVIFVPFELRCMVHTRRIRHSKVEESNNGKIHRKKQNITKAANLFVCAGGVCAMFHVRIEKCDKNRKQKTQKRKRLWEILTEIERTNMGIPWQCCRLRRWRLRSLSTKIAGLTKIKYFMCIIKDGGQEKNRQKMLYNCMWNW